MSIELDRAVRTDGKTYGAGVYGNFVMVDPDTGKRWLVVRSMHTDANGKVKAKTRFFRLRVVATAQPTLH